MLQRWCIFTAPVNDPLNFFVQFAKYNLAYASFAFWWNDCRLCIFQHLKSCVMSNQGNEAFFLAILQNKNFILQRELNLDFKSKSQATNTVHVDIFRLKMYVARLELWCIFAASKNKMTHVDWALENKLTSVIALYNWKCNDLCQWKLNPANVVSFKLEWYPYLHYHSSTQKTRLTLTKARGHRVFSCIYCHEW